MTTLICHPDNLETLKKQLAPVSRIDPRMPASLENILSPIDGIKCITDPYMERTRKTGQYVLPDGRAVPKDQVKFGNRFIEYGPEDIELALFMGWVKEEETLAYFLMKPPEILDISLRAIRHPPCYRLRIPGLLCQQVEHVMIPRNDSRITGTGGGGQSGGGAGTPFFCKICGRTVGRKHVQYGVDVCKKCRVKPGRSKTRGKRN